ncbi:MAG: hypothetical protein ACRELY_27135 [Polyangiaceae bacterium]
MSEQHEIQCYEYVNRPYDRVSAALIDDAVGLFRRATRGASKRADALVATLKLHVAGFEVGKNIVIRVKHIDASGSAPGNLAPEATRLAIDWEAETNAGLFPSMRAELAVYPLSAEETQLDLRGTYTPPGGILGNAADRLVGHRMALASMHRFLDDLSDGLRRELEEARDSEASSPAPTAG